MTPLPEVALSIRQPWAHAVIYLGKPVENRSWKAVEKGAMGIRRIAVHAGKGMTREEYEEARDFMASIGVTCPPAAELLRGGIIGSVDVIGVVKRHASPWFFGPLALVLRDPKPCAFVPAVGQLGYFKWTATEGGPDEPAKWMLTPAQAELIEPSEQGVLL